MAFMEKIAKRNLLITLDVFETLIRPRKPIGLQYYEEAQKFGLDLRRVEPLILDKAFKLGLRGQSHTRFPQFIKKDRENPLYGKAMGISVEQWWSNVITATLSNFTIEPIPEEFKKRLFERFSSSEAYELYPDVLPFLESLHQKNPLWPYAPLSTNLISAFHNRFLNIPQRLYMLNLLSLEREGFTRYLSELHPQPQSQYLINTTNPSDPAQSELSDVTLLGIVSNSDPRVPLILKSLGIKKYFPPPLILLSHEIGIEKPSREIFRQARERAMLLTGIKNWEDWDVFHIGNKPKEDFETPEKLKGFRGVWLDRRVVAKNMSRPVGHTKVTRRITSFSQFYDVVGKRWKEQKEAAENKMQQIEETIKELDQMMQVRKELRGVVKDVEKRGESPRLPNPDRPRPKIQWRD